MSGLAPSQFVTLNVTIRLIALVLAHVACSSSFSYFSQGKEGHLGALVREGAEGVDDEAGGGAVEDVDGGGADPGLQVVDGHGDVLREGLVEHPDLPVGRRPRHAVPVVVEQHALVLQHGK